MSDEIRRIVEQLRAAFEGPAWHGPSVLEALGGVTEEEARQRPIASAHTIFELVLHLGGAYALVLRRLTGDPRNLSPEEDWPPVPASPSGFLEAVNALHAQNRALRAAIADFPAERLDQPLVAEPPYTAYTQFIGLTQHDLWHAGQIVLLRRVLPA